MRLTGIANPPNARKLSSTAPGSGTPIPAPGPAGANKNCEGASTELVIRTSSMMPSNQSVGLPAYCPRPMVHDASQSGWAGTPWKRAPAVSTVPGNEVPGPWLEVRQPGEMDPLLTAGNDN